MLLRIACAGCLLALLIGSASAAEVSLDGTWQLHRSASGEPPGHDAEWQAVKVPSFLSQANGLPFLWYRRTFRVQPAFLFLSLCTSSAMIRSGMMRASSRPPLSRDSFS